MHKNSKTAEHVEEPDPQVTEGALRAVLVHLLALYQLYYFAHWTSRGSQFYGDHQLFERLYKSTQEEFDSVAERLVGLVGSPALGGVFTMAAAKNAAWTEQGQGDVIVAARTAEHDTLRAISDAYRHLDARSSLTLGVDDLLMSISSAHETNTYLLKQRAGAQTLRAG